MESNNLQTTNGQLAKTNTFQPTGCLMKDLIRTFSRAALYWQKKHYLLDACLGYHCFHTCLFANAATTDIR